MSELQNAYYDLIVGRKDDKEAFWIKRLRNILESDIHENPLGCKISDTHIRIGKVHLHSFYEAQILFSHPHWVRRFASWLSDQLLHFYGNDTDVAKLNIVGYETYIEPVLFLLKSTNKRFDIQYGIYEAPKYVQSLGKKLAEERIRYEEYQHKDSPYVYVCGISSTLSTFNKMSELNNNRDGLNLSLIQVFPKYDEVHDPEIEKIVKLDKERSNTAVSGDNKCEAVFLVSVKCKWELAEKCTLCFPKNYLDEKPIIQTSDTSVVPVQMIQPSGKQNEFLWSKKPINKIDFFSKDSTNDYLFKDYLYYGHIDRMNHHYKYYIRTGRLVKDIVDRKNKEFLDVNNQFVDYCKYIRKMEIENEKTKTINIIVAPSHFSDKVFPNAINQFVFHGEAHTISFDMNKEYRASFLAKYSNIAYFIEQAKDFRCKLRFYYVDDQLISVETYNRAKSLIKSLMNCNKRENHSEGKDASDSVQIEVFPAVIVFLSRNSGEAKFDYVKDLQRYYSFIDISIPSIRNFADSCPVCKLRQESDDYSRSCALGLNAKHWEGKHNYYDAVSVTQARDRKDIALSKDSSLNVRYMRRFECENELWEEIKANSNDVTSYENAILAVIHKHSEKLKKRSSRKYDYIIDVEYVISIIKAISMPFLYYREHEKRAALRFVLDVIYKYEKDDISTKGIVLKSQRVMIKCENKQKKYELLIVLINCLAAMDSTYLLSTKRIEALCNTVKAIDEERLCLVQNGNDSIKEGFYSSILHAFKRTIHGIGGDAKIKVFDERVIKCLNSGGNYDCLMRLLFLENTNKNREFSSLSEKNKDESVSSSLLSRYEHMYQQLTTACNDAQSKAENKYKELKLKDVFFVYINQKRDWKFPFRNTELESMNYDDKKLKDDMNLLYDYDNNDDDIIAGISFNEERCLIRLDLNAGHEGKDKIGLTSDRKKYKDTEDVLLVMIFSGEASNAIYGIREILKFRHSICSVLSDDLKTGNIYSSIRAKKGGELLKSDKSLTHSTDRDIKALADQAIYLIDTYNPKDIESFKHAFMAVGTYMNRCISYLNTTSIVDDYFTEPDEKKEVAANHQRFINTLQEASWEKGLLFFERYLEDLSNGEDSIYFSTYDNGLRGRINFSVIDSNPKAIISFLRKTNIVPHFVTSATHETKYALLSFIGIFDTLMLNAIKHGPSHKMENDQLDFRWISSKNAIETEEFNEDEKITITCSVKTDYSNDGDILYYDIILRNNTNEKYLKPGITRTFLDKISNDIPKCFDVDVNNLGDGYVNSIIKVNTITERRKKNEA